MHAHFYSQKLGSIYFKKISCRHYAFFIFFFENMEGMAKLLTLPFIHETSHTSEEFQRPGTRLAEDVTGTQAGLLAAWCPQLGAVFSLQGVSLVGSYCWQSRSGGSHSGLSVSGWTE